MSRNRKNNKTKKARKVGYCCFPVNKHFPYEKDFVVSPVSRRFCIKRIKDFVLFIDTVQLMLDQVPSEQGETSLQFDDPPQPCRPDTGLGRVFAKIFLVSILGLISSHLL